MATFTVTTELDVVDAADGLVSLREAVTLANAAADADTINFAAALATKTITLTLGELTLTQDVTIDGDVNGDDKADIIISGNDASRIFNITGATTDVDLLSLTLTDGNAGTGNGGAVLVVYALSLDISNTTITNSAADSGGGIAGIAMEGELTITNSTISGNSATGVGGGISSYSALAVTLVNTTVDGNSAVFHSGGIFGNSNGSFTILNSTITSNTAGTTGGGLGFATSGNVVITNSVVALNTGGSNPAIASVGPSNTDSITIVSSFIAGDPLLGALQDNGGTVMTRAPLAGSLLIDAGDTSLAPTGEAANGTPRVMGAEVDIGAAESSGDLVVTIADDEFDGDFSNGDLSLREAVFLANQNTDANTITFDAALAGSTITLTLGELVLTQDVTIDGDVNGDNKADITISGGGTSRVFAITATTAEVNFESLTITEGNGVGTYSGLGGAVFNDGTLTITDTTIKDSSSVTAGGALYGAGSLTLINATLTGNSSNFNSAIQIKDAALTMINTTVSGNTANNRTIGLLGTATGNIVNSTIVNNTNTNNTGMTVENGVSLTISNSVIAGNGALDIGEIGSNTITATNSFFGSNIADVTGGTNGNVENVTSAQLGLGTLADNGGTVQTINIVDPNSVLIDAGSNAAAAGLTEDANGNPRIDRGTVDVGATEYVNQGADITTTTLSLDEDTTAAGNVAAVDPEGDSFTYSITGGADGALFAIDSSTGALSFLAAPDFEAPGDSGADNVYDIEITTTDAFGHTDVQMIAVTVNDVAETLVVTTELDVVDANDGLLSLREAVTMANMGAAEETITFDSKLAGKIILLAQGELALTNDVVIDGDMNGDGKADITLSGFASRVFSIYDTGTDVDLSSLTLINGNTGFDFGGAIYASSGTTLDIVDTTISNGIAFTGAGIWTAGTLTVTNSTISNNLAFGFGGGVFLKEGAQATFINSTIDGNTAELDGGGISAFTANITILNSTITGNSAEGIGGGIDLYNGASAVITNSVIALNSSGSGNATLSATGPAANTVTATNSVFGSDVDGVTTGVNGNIENVADVGLGELLDNRGTVLTRAPLDGSILIGIGSTALLPLDIFDIDGDGNVAELLPQDATGEKRVQNGTLDAGAVEYTRNETIGGTDQANTIVGGLGNDRLSGADGDDTMSGGSGRDWLAGGEGADFLDGGTGSDTAEYKDSAAGVVINLQENTASGGDAEGDTLVRIENLTGSIHDDTLTGNARKNALAGGNGADTLSGMDGADTLRGGGGDDTLDGGGGHDKLYGGKGADTIVLSPPLPTALGFDDDLIFAFEAGIDKLAIKQAAFGADFTVGLALDADQFASTADGQAVDAEDRFILDTTTGRLYFDGDGSGTTLDRYLLATFRDGIPVLSETDFIVI